MRVPGGRIQRSGALLGGGVGAGLARAGQAIGSAMMNVGQRMLVQQRTSRLYRAETELIAGEQAALKEIETAPPGQGTEILRTHFDEVRDRMIEEWGEDSGGTLEVLDQRIERRMAVTGAAVRREERGRMREVLLEQAEELIKGDIERAASATRPVQRVDAMESIRRTLANLLQAGAIEEADFEDMINKATEAVGDRFKEIIKDRLFSFQKVWLEMYANTSGDHMRDVLRKRTTFYIDERHKEGFLTKLEAEKLKDQFKAQGDALLRNRIESMNRQAWAAYRSSDADAVHDFIHEAEGLPQKWNETKELIANLRSFSANLAASETVATRLLKMRSGAEPFDARKVPKDPKSLDQYWNTMMGLPGADAASEAKWLADRGIAMPDALIDALNAAAESRNVRDLAKMLGGVGRADDTLGRNTADRVTSDQVLANTVYELTRNADEGTPLFEGIVKLFTDPLASGAISTAAGWLKLDPTEKQSVDRGQAFEDATKLRDIHKTIDVMRQFDAHFIHAVTRQVVNERVDLKLSPETAKNAAAKSAAVAYANGMTDLKVRGNERRPTGTWLVPRYFNVGPARTRPDPFVVWTLSRSPDLTPAQVAKNHLERGLSGWQRDIGDSADVRPDLHVLVKSLDQPLGMLYIPAMSESGPVGWYEWDQEKQSGRLLGVKEDDFKLESAASRELGRSHDARARSRMAHLLHMPEFGVQSVEAYSLKFGVDLAGSFLDWIEADIRAAGDVVDYDDPEQLRMIETMLDARRRWAGWPMWDVPAAPTAKPRGER